MKNENNILAEIGNKNPFTVPENYFENFAAAMEQKISAEKKTKIIPLYNKLKPFYYIAAAVVLAFFVGDYLTIKTSTGIDAEYAETYTMPESSDVLLAYIDEHTLVEYYLTAGEEL